MNDGIHNNPRHDLDDAEEFFRQGDEGEYAERESASPGSLAFIDEDEEPDAELLERQLARRTRYTRYVTALMLLLGSGTVAVFALRGLTEPGETAQSGGVGSAIGAAAAQPAHEHSLPEQNEQTREPAASRRIEAARGELPSATRELPATRSTPSAAPSQVETRESGPRSAPQSALTAAPATDRPTVPRAPVPSSRATVAREQPTPRVERPLASAVQRAPSQASPTPGASAPIAPTPPPTSYRPPTLRFDD